MTFFESLLLLMFAAIVLLQLARRLSLPYPALLAAAGVLIALLPGSPKIEIEPETYLALLIAPVLVDAAFDFPLGAARRLFLPLFFYAVVAVVITAFVVAWIGKLYLGLPFSAALVMGAIVAPPDAAAATAVLRRFSIPREVDSILQGESLFNDATALLLFSAGLAFVNHHMDAGSVTRLVFAAPGGILFGVASAYLIVRVNPLVRGTLGGNLLQFVFSYAIWIIASHLGLSAVLATVAFAMTAAHRTAPAEGALDARMRIQSYAVWSAVVFTLNVFAFLLMGMQARVILGRMERSQLHSALIFAAIVVAVVIAVRPCIVLAFRGVRCLLARMGQRCQPAPLGESLFIGWCGMRGFVTMATALALPQGFPHRDTLVLAAFAVVLTTLVVQGVTLAPMIQVLCLSSKEAKEAEALAIRVKLADAALNALTDKSGSEADNLRFRLRLIRDTCMQRQDSVGLQRLRELGLVSVLSQRQELERLRDEDAISTEAYLESQEQIDWLELTFLRGEERRIEEI